MGGKRIARILLLLLLAGMFTLAVIRPALASPRALNGYDLVGAVNNLRAGEGLPPLEINGALMSIAQAHAEYQAGIGSCTHYGASGDRPRDRALAAGYGGGSDVIISENIACASDPDLQVILYQMWADEAHWNTMTKSTYTHIGGGVATSGGTTYLTIDAGWIRGVAPAPTSPSAPVVTQAPGDTSPPEGETQEVDPGLDIQIEPVWVATPLPDGSIIHIVQSGQALWNIASAYNTTAGELVTLNGLAAGNPILQPGQEILVRPPQPATSTPTKTMAVIALARTPTATLHTGGPVEAQAAPEPPKKDRTTLWIIITVAAGMLALVAVSLISK